MNLEVIGLFASAFGSATLLPGSSEAALVGLLALGDNSVTLLVIVATIGNTLGSLVNWAIGKYAINFRHRKWFPVTSSQIDTYTQWYGKWGIWSLWMSWVPIIGDPLTVISGMARTPLWVFLSVVVLAKFGRYCVVAGLILSAF